MIIPTIDTGLESLLREGLPLPKSLGDISFESPSGTWSAQLSRITVNLFLFGVGRSEMECDVLGASQAGCAGRAAIHAGCLHGVEKLAVCPGSRACLSRAIAKSSPPLVAGLSPSQTELL